MLSCRHIVKQPLPVRGLLSLQRIHLKGALHQRLRYSPKITLFLKQSLNQPLIYQIRLPSIRYLRPRSINKFLASLA